MELTLRTVLRLLGRRKEILWVIMLPAFLLFFLRETYLFPRETRLLLLVRPQAYAQWMSEEERWQAGMRVVDFYFSLVAVPYFWEKMAGKRGMEVSFLRRRVLLEREGDSLLIRVVVRALRQEEGEKIARAFLAEFTRLVREGPYPGEVTVLAKETVGEGPSLPVKLAVVLFLTMGWWFFIVVYREAGRGEKEAEERWEGEGNDLARTGAACSQYRQDERG